MEEMQNEELLEQRFFMDDVLTALQHMSSDRAERVLKNFTMEKLIIYVNQEPSFWESVYDRLKAQAEYYNDILTDFQELNGLLSSSEKDKVDRTIADITEAYRKMDVVDKVRLNRRLQKENTLADSICLLLGTAMGLKGDCHGTETEL
jgi:hypothetical protein